jgi:hypothetical protein
MIIIRSGIQFITHITTIYCMNISNKISIKTVQHEHTIIVADHFYSINYLEQLADRNYTSVRNYLVIYIVICAGIFCGCLAVLIVTFKFLEIKSLSMIPLLSLIALTICAALFIIQIMRLMVINKVISGEYDISDSLLRLIIFKIKNTKDDIKGPDLFGEIATCCTDCTKNDRDRDDKNA